MRQIRFFFARSSNKDAVTKATQFEVAKIKMFNKFTDRSQQTNYYPHTDKIHTESLYASTAYIIPMTTNNSSSISFACQTIDKIRPTHLLLDSSDAYMRRMTNSLHFSNRTPRYLPEKLFCKAQIVRAVNECLSKFGTFLYDEKEKVVYVANHLAKRLVAESTFSAAQQAGQDPECKVSFGKPSEIIYFQDMILRFSVQDLQLFLDNAITVARKDNVTQLYFSENFVLECIRHHSQTVNPQLYSTLLTFTTALLNTYCRIEKRVILLTPAAFAQHIATQVHHTAIPPQSIFRNFNGTDGQLQRSFMRIMQGKCRSQVLEKVAILSILLEGNLSVDLTVGINCFENSIFKDLFIGLSAADLTKQFLVYRNSYLEKVKSVSREWAFNNLLHLHPRQQEYLRLQQQLTLNDSRLPEFPTTFTFQNNRTIHQDKAKGALLKSQVFKEAEKRCSEIQKELVRDFFVKKVVNKASIILVSKLIGLANIQMHDKLKLPIYHFGAFRGLYKSYLKNFMLTGDPDPSFRDNEPRRSPDDEIKYNKFLKDLNDPVALTKILKGEVEGVKVQKIDFTPEGQKGSQFRKIMRTEDAISLQNKLDSLDKEEFEKEYEKLKATQEQNDHSENNFNDSRFFK